MVTDENHALVQAMERAGAKSWAHGQDNAVSFSTDGVYTAAWPAFLRSDWAGDGKLAHTVDDQCA